MTIRNVAKKLGISAHTIRYYEKLGLIRSVEREGGKRVFTGLDVQWLTFILRLKKTGMPLKKIKKYSDLRYLGDTTITERKAMLLAHRDDLEREIADLQSGLAALDQKIIIYSEMEQKNDPVQKRIEKA